MLLSGLFGNETAEKVLLLIANTGSGYPRGIATTFGLAVSQVQRQLERFELEGILSSRLVGRTRVYEFNPRYLFQDELAALLKKALKNLPPEVLDRYFTRRTRPRRRGKPL
ncbi:MAG: ArsR family transcriptional regulator [Oligoflexia bacterium]|nr:ArsR family transcriptional regulator [Oligoflexia bacterium]